MNKELQEAVQMTATELGLVVQAADHSRWKELLAEKIDELIREDFQKLVHILYRMDVSEIKLRSLLESQSNEPAGILIAGLMIERQEQKIKTREMFQKNNRVNDEDAW